MCLPSKFRCLRDNCSRSARTRYAHPVLRTIIIVLLVLWLLGFLLRAFGGLIHLLLIVVLVIVIYRLVTGRPVV